MYKCQACKAQSEPGEKQRHVVTETRPKTYINGEYGEKISKGTEIVKELAVCEKCSNQSR